MAIKYKKPDTKIHHVYTHVDAIMYNGKEFNVK